MITFEEVKELFKESIDATDTMNKALEHLMQSIYQKGYNEALEQEPCEDCISRQAVYEWLDGWKEKNKYYHPHTKNEIIPICEVTDIIQSLPSVTPQQKIGQRLCRTCIYGDKTEYDKPCIIYSDNCQLYKAKILDKIRAEIAEAWKNEPCATEHGCLDEILQIIDKAESEVEEYGSN
jgi:hypothetical protein